MLASVIGGAACAKGSFIRSATAAALFRLHTPSSRLGRWQTKENRYISDTTVHSRPTVMSLPLQHDLKQALWLEYSSGLQWNGRTGVQSCIRVMLTGGHQRYFAYGSPFKFEGVCQIAQSQMDCQHPSPVSFSMNQIISLCGLLYFGVQWSWWGLKPPIRPVVYLGSQRVKMYYLNFLARYNVQRGKFSAVSDGDIKFFQELLGPHRIVLGEEELEGHNTDWLGTVRGASAVLLKPKTTEEVSAILSYCNQHQLAVCPQGELIIILCKKYYNEWLHTPVRTLYWESAFLSYCNQY